MSDAPAGLIPPKFNIDQPRFETRDAFTEIERQFKIYSMNKHMHTDGTRAHIGEERGSFSQLQTP